MNDVSVRSDLELAAKLFRSLGDPMRLAIVQILAGGERRVVDLVAELRTSQPNVSGHLACLKDCGLVADRPVGRAVMYRLASPELFDVLRSAEALLEGVGHQIALCPNIAFVADDADRFASSKDAPKL
jgi:ArsR family transcriptional regulator, cadmium/lead-responsive transcriptional repressor